MKNIKASMLMPARQESRGNLEGIASGSILIINDKQFAVNNLTKSPTGTYYFEVLRKEARHDNQEVILQQDYSANKNNLSTGKIVEESPLNCVHSSSKMFKGYLSQLRILELKTKQHPF